MYNPKEGTFNFRPGPIFCQILLADEINRASPRTQSALLEAMAELQVTIEGERHDLPSPFLVLATQNPVEFHGTYPLPEDVQQMAVAVLAHRLTLNTKAKYDGTDKNAVVNAVLESVKVPV